MKKKKTLRNSYRIFTFITGIHCVAVFDLSYSRFQILFRINSYNNQVNNHLILKIEIVNPFFD